MREKLYEEFMNLLAENFIPLRSFTSFQPIMASNVPSKSSHSVRGMEGRLSSKKKGSARKIESTYLVVLLSILKQCAAERKYCAGVLRQLRGAQLRGNVDGQHCIKFRFGSYICSAIIIRSSYDYRMHTNEDDILRPHPETVCSILLSQAFSGPTPHAHW